MPAAKARRYVFADQLVPRAARPWETEQTVELSDHERVVVRPLRLSDVEPLRDMLYRLSNESVYQRFFQHKKVHPRQELKELVTISSARRTWRSSSRQRTAGRSWGWGATTSTLRRGLPTSRSSWPTPGK